MAFPWSCAAGCTDAGRCLLLSCALSALPDTGRAADCSQPPPFKKGEELRNLQRCCWPPAVTQGRFCQLCSLRIWVSPSPFAQEGSSSSSKQLGWEEKLRSGPAQGSWCCCCDGGRELPPAVDPLSRRKHPPCWRKALQAGLRQKQGEDAL